MPLCQIAGVRPNIFAESAAPRVLLQLAEAGHGVAVIPSILQHDFGKLRVCTVTYRGDPLLLKLAVLWDRMRTLPRHAQEFSELLAEHIRATFPGRRGAAPNRLALVRYTLSRAARRLSSGVTSITRARPVIFTSALQLVMHGVAQNDFSVVSRSSS